MSGVASLWIMLFLVVLPRDIRHEKELLLDAELFAKPGFHRRLRCKHLTEDAVRARPVSAEHRPVTGCGVKPDCIIKGGSIVAALMGDPNASIPTPQPVHYRPMFGR